MGSREKSCGFHKIRDPETMKTLEYGEDLYFKQKRGYLGLSSPQSRHLDEESSKWLIWEVIQGNTGK